MTRFAVEPSPLGYQAQEWGVLPSGREYCRILGIYTTVADARHRIADATRVHLRRVAPRDEHIGDATGIDVIDDAVFRGALAASQGNAALADAYALVLADMAAAYAALPTRTHAAQREMRRISNDESEAAE